MALLTVIEKLNITNEKNILIQGLPSSLEKQFVKLPYAKSVTPLLKTRKIDFALVFAINRTQLKNILQDVIPAMAENANLWVSYPKPTAKIASDLLRNNDWECVNCHGYENSEEIVLDNVWGAIRFEKCCVEELSSSDKSSKKLASVA